MMELLTASNCYQILLPWLSALPDVVLKSATYSFAAKELASRSNPVVRILCKQQACKHSVAAMLGMCCGTSLS